jgi:hypothetical protein
MLLRYTSLQNHICDNENKELQEMSYVIFDDMPEIKSFLHHYYNCKKCQTYFILRVVPKIGVNKIA